MEHTKQRYKIRSHGECLNCSGPQWLTFFQINSFMFHRRKSCRFDKCWQYFHIWENYPFKSNNFINKKIFSQFEPWNINFSIQITFQSIHKIYKAYQISTFVMFYDYWLKLQSSFIISLLFCFIACFYEINNFNVGISKLKCVASVTDLFS